MSEIKKEANTDKPLHFEQSMTELETLVNALEKGEMSLEDALAAFEKGITLTKTCQQQLDQAKQKVLLLVGDGDELHLEDFDHNDE